MRHLRGRVECCGRLIATNADIELIESNISDRYDGQWVARFVLAMPGDLHGGDRCQMELSDGRAGIGQVNNIAHSAGAGSIVVMRGSWS